MFQLLLAFIIQIRMSNQANIPRKKNYFTKSQAALPVLHAKQEFTAIIEMKKQYQSLIKKELELLSQFQNEEVKEQNEWEGKIERKETYIMPFVLSEPEKMKRQVKGEGQLRNCFQELRKVNMGRYFKRVAQRLQWIKKQGMKHRAVKFFYEQNAQTKCFKAWSQHTKHKSAQINLKGVEHYKWKNLPQFFKAWKGYIKRIAIQNFDKSESHYLTRLLTTSMNTWKEYAKIKEEERLQKGEFHYRGQILFKFFNDWAQNVNQMVTQQREYARSYLEKRIFKRGFESWDEISKVARRERQENERASLAKIKQQESKIQEQLQSKEAALRQREEELLARQRSISAMESEIITTKNDIIHQKMVKEAELQSLKAQQIEQKKEELLKWEKKMAQRQKSIRQRQAQIAEKNKKISQQSQQQLQRLEELQTKRKQLENMQKYTRLRLKELQDREQAIANKDREIEQKRQALQEEYEQEKERQFEVFQKEQESQMRVMLFEQKRQLINDANEEEFVQSAIKPRSQSPLVEQYQEEDIDAIQNSSFSGEQEGEDSSKQDEPQQQQKSSKSYSQPFEQQQQLEESVEQAHRIESNKQNQQDKQDKQAQQAQITAKIQPEIPDISQLLSQSSQINPNFLKYLLDKPNQSESDPQDDYDIQYFQKQLYSKLFLRRLKSLKQAKKQYERSSSQHRFKLLEKAFHKWKEGVLFERDLRIDNNLSLIICQTEIKAIFLKRMIKCLQQNSKDLQVNRNLRDNSAIVRQTIKNYYFTQVRLALKLNYESQKDSKTKKVQIKALLFNRLIKEMRRVNQSNNMDESQFQAKTGIKKLYLIKIISKMRNDAMHARNIKSIRNAITSTYLRRMISSFGKLQQSLIQKEEQETRVKYCLARYNKNLLKKVFKAIHIGSSMRHIEELKVKCIKGLKMYTQQKKMLRKCLEIEQQSQGKGYSYYPTTEEQHRHFQQLLADE